MGVVVLGEGSALYSAGLTAALAGWGQARGEEESRGKPSLRLGSPAGDTQGLDSDHLAWWTVLSSHLRGIFS